MNLSYEGKAHTVHFNQMILYWWQGRQRKKHDAQRIQTGQSQYFSSEDKDQEDLVRPFRCWRVKMSSCRVTPQALPPSPKEPETRGQNKICAGQGTFSDISETKGSDTIWKHWSIVTRASCEARGLSGAQTEELPVWNCPWWAEVLTHPSTCLDDKTQLQWHSRKALGDFSRKNTSCIQDG